MIKRYLFLFISCLFLILPGKIISQSLSNQQKATIYTQMDTIQYDTLATVAESTILLDTAGRVISDTCYTIRPWKSILIPGQQLKKDHQVVYLKYRTMPKSFTEAYFHKNIEEIREIPERVFTYQKFAGTTKSTGSGFQAGKIIQSGSISRGLTIGNNQDAVVNSGMDLQLSGKLSDNLNITGAISDKNIPIQADGTTQKIRDLDRVYLKAYSDQTDITAGDYKISDPSGYFMKLDKKVQGAGVSHSYDLTNETQAVSSMNGAVSKGRYCVQSFRGEEGNQGPYKLTGCNNETHIIMLSGSEQVYIDGDLMKRGKNHDYVINYNTSEITFTSNRPITKDKRIKVEFEYSLNEYARFTAFTHNTVQTGNGKLWLNLFSEHDSKSQTFAQDLTEDQKDLLYSIGDDLDNAVVPHIDTGSYRNDRILYAKTDTVVNGQHYSIYRYSTDREEARYKLGFSHVGKNNGNYTPVKSSANGRVYKWVAPVNGEPRGSYSPMRTLITPKKQQMLTFGGSGDISSTTSTFFELALSNNDLNTFSPRDQENNRGYALNFSIDKDFVLTDTSKTRLSTTFSYRGIHENFNSLQRFKAVEFERNWNLRSREVSGNEHLISGGIDFQNQQLGQSGYQFEYLSYGNGYSGYRNHLNTDMEHSGFQFSFSGNYLNTSGNKINTDFLRYQADLGRHFSNIKLGVKNSGEHNQWHRDSLMHNSFAFNQWEFYMTNPDTAVNNYFLNYQIREDQSPMNNTLEPITTGKNLNMGIGLHSLENNTLKARLTYRRLRIKDTSLTGNKPEDNLVGRIEHSLRAFNGFLTTSTNFEIGSGLEPRREFTYIEVAKGQGVYTWTDYNENNVKELDEFEKANFSDQADYIRVQRPSGEYYKTHTNELNQIINLKPQQIIRDTTKFKKLIARFSDQLAFSIRRKNRQKNNFVKNLNPFAYSINNPLVLSQNSNIRNTFSFNKNNPLYTVEYIFRKSKNKMLLMNGTDLKTKNNQALQATWNITPTLTFENKAGIEKEHYSSEYFQNKNYRLKRLNESLSFLYRPFSSFRIEFEYEYSAMDNRAGEEKANKHQIGTQFNYSKSKKFRIKGSFSFIHYQYGFPEDTPIAYQILEGLKRGRNGTWNLVFQKELYKNLELNLNYSGRVSQNHNAFHTGQVELRANF
ncbi:MAG: hypothetical protein V5A59_10335 [Bacteroidales bacterium]|nr:hypothetical protein [Bacteroidales bacterium]